MKRRKGALKPGTLVEFRYHAKENDGANGRRGRIVRQIASYSQYYVRIESVPASWTPEQAAQQVGKTTGWWAIDFVIVKE